MIHVGCCAARACVVCYDGTSSIERRSLRKTISRMLLDALNLSLIPRNLRRPPCNRHVSLLENSATAPCSPNDCNAWLHLHHSSYPTAHFQIPLLHHCTLQPQQYRAFHAPASPFAPPLAHIPRPHHRRSCCICKPSLADSRTAAAAAVHFEPCRILRARGHA